uniref:Uncharacterized protein n=1 Tax=Leersia perrieri TaxID=77586 RepID=A0A0D9W1V1_9ORYZ
MVEQNRSCEIPASRPPNHKAVGVLAAAPRHTTPAVDQLEEAKQELEKERSEKKKMAGCILSLQEELTNAMRELTKLKARDDDIDLQVEDLKFVEIEKQNPPPANIIDEFQKRRYVTFADNPPPEDVVMELHHHHHHRAHNHNAPAPPLREVRFMRQMSAGHGMAATAEEERRKIRKKKPLIALVGGLFMRKKKKTGSSSCCHDDSMVNPRTSF